ncbi:MAG TPA: desulfoferrodoxin family protein [Caulobacteraceae bacterium]|nr:desulfoferrodoxin family protein [Caulobacteraceae bacterium]
MLRRDFAKTAILGAAAAAALPAASQAAGMAGDTNIVFSADNPGHWDKVVAKHVPKVDVSGSTLTVTTPHPQSDAHYIVSHTVVLADGSLLGRKTFTPKDDPVSTYTLPAGYKGMVKATSTCNLHDFWVNTAAV